MKRILMSLAVLIASCATDHFVHPTKDERAFWRDLADCRAKAGAASGGRYDQTYDDTVDACLIGEGWTKQQ